MASLIEVRGLTKNFGTLTAVDDIALDVERGEVLGFLGPNGAGKSTTMKMITGFLAPTAGSIAVCGFDIEGAPLAAKAKIGYLPEGAPAYGEMTPATFLDFIADIRGLRGRQGRERIAEIVDKIHLERVLHQRIETLSKGFKRRVGLAQAIVHDPEVLIMDEPTDGLDPNQKHEVRTLIKEMAPNKAIIISTHILEEVESVCSRAVIIAQGRLIFSGTPMELAGRSQYHNATTVVVDAGDATQVRDALGNVPGIRAVEKVTDGSLVRLTALPVNGVNPVDAVQTCVDGLQCKVHEFLIERGRLDEVFRNITTGGDGSGEVHRT